MLLFVMALIVSCNIIATNNTFTKMQSNGTAGISELKFWLSINPLMVQNVAYPWKQN